ncbi:hypothetical protein [Pseudarthrobacter sp. LMD1-1-1.1]|uniref:hypothetical protein n=1 Tax=Pseudarthrobacter sp. LMD1-1-1.1 TaxID=3135242 RepID=UPI00344A5D26
MTLTLQAVQDTLGVWIPKVQGQYINEDWNPENEGFGAQCWDLAANWSKTLGLPVINTGYPGNWVGWAGNMVSAYPQTPAIEAAYELIQPDQPGMAGDIAVWGDSYKEYYPATHVAVLIRDANLQLLCASQNSTSSRADNPYPKWSSGPATIQYLPRRGLIGFLRPRTSSSINYQGSITTSQEDDVTTPEQIDKIVTASAEATQAAINHLYDRITSEVVGKLDELNGAHHVATREHVNGKVPDIAAASAAATLTKQVPYKDPVTGQDTGQTTSLATLAGFADFQAVATRALVAQGPAGVAAQINAAGLAEAVRDELVKLIGGK